MFTDTERIWAAITKLQRCKVSCGSALDCEGVNTCLGISLDADKDLFLNRAGEWVAPGGGGGSGWELIGNSGTVAGDNFIGTIDDISLVFKINNLESGRLTNFAQNTSFGLGSLINVGVGRQSNTGIGYNSLNSITSGIKNTAIGSNSGISTIDGSYNVFIGESSGTSNISGINNVLIGVNSDLSTDSTTNAISLGFGAVASDNQFAIGSQTEIKFLLNTPAIGNILTTSTITGVANWQPITVATAASGGITDSIVITGLTNTYTISFLNGLYTGTIIT